VSNALRVRRGRPVRSRDLLGRVWVADFVFTRCAAVCPILSTRLKSLSQRIGPDDAVRYVSFSVDPAHDTPQVLAEYAARYQADPDRWMFLTGDMNEVERTVVQGFKIFIGDPEPNENDPTLVEIAHGEHFVLVDRAGQLRGYYRSDREGLDRLERHVRELAAAGR
jgi:protein SCO1/2